MPYADPEQRRVFHRSNHARKMNDPAWVEKRRARMRKNASTPEAKASNAASKSRQRAGWTAEQKTAHAALLRRLHLKRAYDLTPEEYEEMRLAQGGGCAICDGDNGNEPLYVDHCHKTGRVRGLLCRACNHALGLFRDQPARLRQAARYLEESCSARTEVA